MNSNQSSLSAKYFDADSPIEGRHQDRLGRRSFSEAIAQHIRSVPADHGFTVAVVGEWGSGKTSVVNMVSETLVDDDDTTAVLRFNPWLFGGTVDLVTLFFRELSAQVGQDKFQGLKEVAKALTGLGQTLAPLSPVPGMIAVANLAAQQTAYWTKPPSLYEKRDQLRKALSESCSRVVVLIDDIDRLEPSETRELVRLVRLTSDLPNLVFLLAFDRRRVAKSLGENENEAEGQLYLDKIVQVSYDIPAVREAILSEMLLLWLNELVEGRDLSQVDTDVWGRILYRVIKPLLENLRDVKRYLYSLPVTLETIGEEVALADLLALEALRVLRASTFEDLKTHAVCLVHSAKELVSEEDRKQELKGLLERAGPEREVMESVLEILFPATQGLLDRISYGPEWNATWRKQRRVACEDVLAIYLHAGIEEGALQSREVQDLVEALTDEERLVGLLDALDDQQFEEALERLADFEQDFPIRAATIAVPVLVNRVARLSKEPASFFGLSPRFKTLYVVARLLRRIEDPKALMDNMEEVLKKVDTLSGCLHLVETVGHRESAGQTLIGKELAMVLEERLVERLNSATVEELAREWDLFALSVRIPRWLEGEDKLRLICRLREHLGDDRFVLALLRTAVGQAQYSTGRVEKRLSWDVLIEAFGEGLADAVDRLARSELCRALSEDDQYTINLARRCASGWRPEE